MFKFFETIITQEVIISTFLSSQSIPELLPITQAWNSDHFGPPKPQKRPVFTQKRTRFHFSSQFSWSQITQKVKYSLKFINNIFAKTKP